MKNTTAPSSNTELTHLDLLEQVSTSTGDPNYRIISVKGFLLVAGLIERKTIMESRYEHLMEMTNKIEQSLKSIYNEQG